MRMLGTPSTIKHCPEASSLFESKSTELLHDNALEWPENHRGAQSCEPAVVVGRSTRSLDVL
jgi:hypothetical protein